MSILIAPPPPIGTAPRVQPSPARWTVDEFHALALLPIFEGRKMILVDGEVLDMPLANHPHDMGIGACQTALEAIFPNSAFWVRVQMALPLGKNTDPGPDLAVAAGSMRSHSRQPSTALLVVEVADSSLDYDTGEKSNLYASGGIKDYWVIDINNRRLHVFRDPMADAAAPFGSRYQTQQHFDAATTVAPIAAPRALVRVGDLLP